MRMARLLRNDASESSFIILKVLNALKFIQFIRRTRSERKVVRVGEKTRYFLQQKTQIARFINSVDQHGADQAVHRIGARDGKLVGEMIGCRSHGCVQLPSRALVVAAADLRRPQRHSIRIDHRCFWESMSLGILKGCGEADIELSEVGVV